MKNKPKSKPSVSSGNRKYSNNLKPPPAHTQTSNRLSKKKPKRKPN